MKRSLKFVSSPRPDQDDKSVGEHATRADKLGARRLCRMFLIGLLCFLSITCGRADTAAVAPSNPWANAPGSKEYPKASSIILKDDIQATVDDNGAHDLIEYDAIKLLDKDAVDHFGHTIRIFDSAVETVEVSLARMWSPNGQMSVVPPSDIKEGTIEAFVNHPLYDRIHQITINFKDAQEGSVVEFRIVHHRKIPWIGKKFWETSYTQDFDPILDTQFTFTYPERMAVNIATPGSPNLAPERVQRLGGRTMMHWHLKDRPALERQPVMPSLRQLSSQIQVSNFSDWSDFANWARTLWEQTTMPDSAITAKTSTLVSGLNSEDKKIRAIMAWIDKEKAMPEADLDPEDIVPATAADTFKAASLIPIDRAVLLLSMLRAANIRAFPALVASSEYGDPTRGVPSLAQFNRILVAVPESGGFTWLDPSIATPNIMEQGLGDRPALVLNGGGHFVTTATPPVEANREEMSGVASLDNDGSMEATLRITEYGSNSVLWRAIMGGAKPKDQHDGFQNLVSRINPSASLRDYYVPPMDYQHPDAPLEMTISFEVAHGGNATLEGNAFQFRVPLLAQWEPSSYTEVAPDKRLYPVVLGKTIYNERRMQIVLPTGWTVKTLPHTVSRSNSIGSYQADIRSDDHNIYYFTRLIVRRSEIPLADYAQFKELLDLVTATGQEQIVLNMPTRAGRVNDK